MKPHALLHLLAITLLSGCTPIVISPTATNPSPTTALPDLVISSVYLAMQGLPGYPSNCVTAYAPYEIRAIVENRGSASAADVLVVEQSTGHQVQIGPMQPSQSIEIQFPLNSASGSYTVVADPQNVIMESNENNNVYAYLAPTPTPPALCPPASAQPTLPPTMIPATPSALSLDGLSYADMNLGQIWKVLAGGHPAQLMNGIAGQFSPDGLQVLFEQSGDLWLAEPMDNPGRNITNTAARTEQFPQWWPSNPSKIAFNSMGLEEAKEINWGHDVSGYLTMINRDGSEYSTLSAVPSYTRPALSPDGKTIAYDALGQPMLYETAEGPRPFEVSSYGYQPELERPVFTSPSFSPDGRWLTWWISEGPSESQRHFTLVMFDLAANSYRVVHSFTPLANTLGWLDTPVWSPAGQWVAFQTRGEETPWDLWVMHRDGGIGQRFGLATNPVWSPDSRLLAFVQWPPHSDSYLSANTVIVEIPSATIQQTGLPAGSIPLAWKVIASP